MLLCESEEDLAAQVALPRLVLAAYLAWVYRGKMEHWLPAGHSLPGDVGGKAGYHQAARRAPQKDGAADKATGAVVVTTALQRKPGADGVAAPTAGGDDPLKKKKEGNAGNKKNDADASSNKKKEA